MAMRAFRGPILSVLLSAPVVLTAQDCKERVQAALQRMAGEVDSAAHHAVKSELRITSSTWNPKDQGTRTVITLSSKDGASIVENEHFTVYEDRETRVMVIDHTKLVSIQDQPVVEDDAKPRFWEQFNDTLLRVAEVSQCRHLLPAGQERWEITLEVPEAIDLQRTATVRFTLDADGGLLSTRTEYRKGAAMRTYQVDYLAYAPGALDPRLRKPALENVMHRGQPLEQFANHRFKDIRSSVSGTGIN